MYYLVNESNDYCLPCIKRAEQQGTKDILAFGFHSFMCSQAQHQQALKIATATAPVICLSFLLH